MPRGCLATFTVALCKRRRLKSPGRNNARERARSGARIGKSRDCTRTATAVAMAVFFIGLYRLHIELRAVSSYLIAVVAIMKRCRDRLLQLSSTAVVSVKRWRVW